MVQKKKKAKKKASKTVSASTPHSVVTSLIVALPLFVGFGIRDIVQGSFDGSTLFAMVCLFLQGMALAFFWRRISSPSKGPISGLYVAILWAFLGAQAVASFAALPMAYINLGGLVGVALVSTLVMIIWVGQSSHAPSTVLSLLMGVGLAGATIYQIQSGSNDLETITMSAKSMKAPIFDRGNEDEIIATDDEVSAPEPKRPVKGKTSQLMAMMEDALDSSDEEDPSKRTMKRPDIQRNEAPKNETQTIQQDMVSSEETPAPIVKPKKQRIDWSYRGSKGPRHWARLNSSFKTCGRGKEQSPINIPGKWELRNHIMVFNRPMDYNVVDDGHGIKVNFPQGIQTHVSKKPYELKELVLRSPSEHQYENRAFPMELQFVHQNARGHKSIVGVLVVEGKENPEMNKILNYFPKSVHSPISPTGAMIDIKKILPKSLKSFHYYGSLTEPPCTEGVNWNILNNPIEMSKSQIRKFRTRYRNNARPVQALYHRK